MAIWKMQLEQKVEMKFQYTGRFFEMEKNEIVKSEIGSEAAWRGFSTQTLYIAKRLLTAEDDEQLYPEQVEDLMIM